MIDAAEVHGDELPGLDDLFRGYPVGQASVGAGHHDGIEGLVLRPVVEHEILEPGGDLLLRDAGPDLVQDIRQGLLRWAAIMISSSSGSFTARSSASRSAAGTSSQGRARA